jgi:tetratricopeptide (TPR) repeat protein
MRDNTVPKRNWLLFILVSLGVWNTALPGRTQALLPYSPNLDAAQLEQQGLALTEDVIQLVRFQQYDLALSRAKLATQLAPQKYQTWFILGTLYLQKEDLDQGVAALLKAQGMAPNEAGIKFTLGNAYFQKGDYNAAIASIEAGLKLKPNVPTAFFDLGNSFLKLGKWGDAVNSYEKAISFDKAFWPAINNTGLVKYEQGDIEGALKKWQAATSIDKEQAEPQLAIAVALYAQGKQQEALKLGENALKIDSRYGDLKFLKDNLWGEKLLQDTKTLLTTPTMKSFLSSLPVDSENKKKEVKTPE